MNALPFELSVTRTANASTVYLTGEIDFAASLELEPELDSITRGCRTELRLDLRGVALIDSEGLKMLLRACRMMHSKGSAARVTALSPRAKRIIQIAGIGDLLGCGDLISPPTPQQCHVRSPGRKRSRQP